MWFGVQVVICLLLILLPACSGTPHQGTVESGEADSVRPDFPAIALDCLELLSSYREVNLERASEAELERQLEEALLNRDLCGQALRSSYDGPGGQVMANHLARTLDIHALKVELALSARFDQMSGYCTILEDLVRALQADLTEIEEALRSSSLHEQDRSALVSLQELTVQGLQLSLLDYGESCR